MLFYVYLQIFKDGQPLNKQIETQEAGTKQQI